MTEGAFFDGVLIDHDLQLRSLTDVDEMLSGKDVADAVIQYIDNDVPIFVHSANRTEGPKLVARLMAQGFIVEARRFECLEVQEFRAWLSEVADASDAVPKYRRWKQERERRSRTSDSRDSH